MNLYGKWGGGASENISYGRNNALDVVVALLVDANVPGKGHRKNMFNENMKLTGIYYGEHTGFRQMTCIDYAKSFIEKNGSLTKLYGSESWG